MHSTIAYENQESKTENQLDDAHKVRKLWVAENPHTDISGGSDSDQLPITTYLLKTPKLVSLSCSKA